MKLSIDTNQESEELLLYFSHHVSNVLTNHLLQNMNIKEIYNLLHTNYNEILKEKKLGEYKEYGMSDKSYEDKIFSLLLNCERDHTYIYYATVLELAKNKGLEYLKLFILIDYKLNFTKTFDFNSKMLFGEESIEYVIKLLSQAKDNELIKTSPRVADCLLSEATGKVMEIEDKAGNFIESLLENSEKIEYILFEDPDEYMNNLEIHNNNFEKDYKTILLSKDFQDYIREDENFGEYDIQEFEDYVINYLETKEELSMSREIIDKIKNEKIKDAFYTKKIVEELFVEEKSLI